MIPELPLDARESATIPCVGNLAHESARNGGDITRLPELALKG